MSVIDGNGKENFLLSYLFPKELDTTGQIDLHHKIKNKLANVMHNEFPEVKFTLGDSEIISPLLTDSVCEWQELNTDKEYDAYKNCKYDYDEICPDFFKYCPYCRRKLEIKSQEESV